MKETFVVHTNFIADSDALLQWLKDFDAKGEYVVKGERNSIKKYKVEGAFVNAKKFKTPNIFQSLVYQFLRKSKARRSFEYAEKLIHLGIHTPFPVAYYERFVFGLKESFYISQHLEYDFDFRVLNHNPKWPNRKEILEQMATFTFQLHERNINFMDHSPGNTLIIEKDKGDYEFYLIDLNRIRFEKMNFHQRMKNFRRLWLSKTMINIMAPIYAKLYGTTEAETYTLMTFYSRKFQRKVNSKKMRKRKKRIFNM
ncbi:lipopolysaccharide kinase InaA family protein [Aureisphaera sp. CAU 1614]|uniref:Lipopolysaccharide kinase InaA family protein n=1 Tax=Halomarinibacterium sedimenti TaxID=2857106 RepID=A0A9X1K0E2_9FLAO|nr:lipopolysaccharide kinase InaA family protein [Halomarinibacterium sedimenti]MBW2938356.1 lipopolysaccharide kinase InaA family protein [Halomarinibacterium sedimenti]